MIRKKITVLIVSVALFLPSAKQEKPFRQVIKIKSDYFTVDNLGNIYMIKDEELVKLLPNGRFFARYSNLKLGAISSVDVTNPLKLVLYYRDFQQIVFLDNQLSVNSENVALEKLGFEQTDLVCASVNNSFWIYNKQNNELLRFNENSKKISSTGNLKQILQTDLNPNYMLEHNGYLYLNCPAQGIYLFDIFGAFSKVISIKQLQQFQVNENIIYYQKDSLFCSYSHKTFEEGCKPIPYSNKVSSIKYRANKLYQSFKDSLLIQDFN